MALHELSDEQAYEAELAHCVGVTGYHRWFFLAALAEALGLRLRAFAVSAGATTRAGGWGWCRCCSAVGDRSRRSTTFPCRTSARC